MRNLVKSLFVVFCVLMMVMVLSCPNDDKDDGGGEDKIEAKYQGKFLYDRWGQYFYITLTKDKITFSRKQDSSSSERTVDTFLAWTNGNELWGNVTKRYTEKYVSGSKPNDYWTEKLDYKLGTFTDQNTISVFHYEYGGNGGATGTDIVEFIRQN